ncbi:hypothetical protein GF573_08280 [Staphylococcus aureus]|nr:hypothetical protein [Staphylococcus aureus]
MRNFKNDNELLGGNEMPTLYELKQSLGMIGQQLKNKGEYLFVLTAWYDQQRTLDSAFRIAKAKENTGSLPS